MKLLNFKVGFYIKAPAVTVVLLLLLIFLSGCHTEKTDEESVNQPPNILFISIDDLRNELRAFGTDYIKTPNLDAFAVKSRIFTRHYVQVPTYGSSRAALLRGKRVDGPEFIPNTAIVNTHEEWADRSLPGSFRSNGYQTLSLEKITHYPGGLTGKGWAEGPEELPGSGTGYGFLRVSGKNLRT